MATKASDGTKKYVNLSAKQKPELKVELGISVVRVYEYGAAKQVVSDICRNMANFHHVLTQNKSYS